MTTVLIWVGGLAVYWLVGAAVLALVDFDGALFRWWDARPKDGLLELGLELALVIGWPVLAALHWWTYVRRRTL